MSIHDYPCRCACGCSKPSIIKDKWATDPNRWKHIAMDLRCYDCQDRIHLPVSTIDARAIKMETDSRDVQQRLL